MESEITPEVFQRGVTALSRLYARQRKEELERCWFQGSLAKGRFDRVSPYYEDPGADIFWFAGFDGFSLQEAIVLHDAAYDRGKAAA